MIFLSKAIHSAANHVRTASIPAFHTHGREQQGKFKMTAADSGSTPNKLRSRAWFDNPENPDMAALYRERYMNFGVSREELQSGKPIIGIAQTGSDLSPCNRHHIVLAERLREGIREAGGIAIEFPVHPIQETGKRPTAGLDRNLAYLGLVEVLYGRSEEHTSELQSRPHLVCRLLLEKKKNKSSAHDKDGKRPR